MQHFTTERTITFEAARLVLGAAVDNARSLGVPVCVAVTDRSGNTGAASVTITEVRIRNRWIRSSITRFVALEGTEAVTPGVISAKRHAFAGALAHFEQQSVVAGFAATLDLHEIGDVLSGVLKIC